MLVEKKQLKLAKPFTLINGAVLKQPIVAYEEYGRSNGPVIFLSHGGLSDCHAAGRYAETDPLPGWWDGMVGPGKAYDTDKFRVICANFLGSMWGSSGPLSINPDTGHRYGPNFPFVTLIDCANFYKAFLDELGIKRVEVASAPSMGSLISLQLAALFPDFVGSVVAVTTAGRMPPSGMAMHHLMMNLIKMDPDFQAGWYDRSKPLLAMKYIGQVGRIYYTHEKLLKTFCWDTIPEGTQSQDLRSRAVNAFLSSTPDIDVLNRDPNCYITLLNAINSFDLGRDVDTYQNGVRRIKCPVLMISIDTDVEFDVMWAREVADILNAVRPGQAQVELIQSIWGHLGGVKEHDKMSALIKPFLQRVPLAA